jgi:hypothetical protein
MKDRLIEILGDFPTFGGTTLKQTWMPEAVEKLADHLLSKGVIVPPCKVGQTVFFYTCVCDKEGEVKFDIFDGEVISFALQKEGLLAYCHYKCGLTYWHLVKKDFGKTVFSTREEAEIALAERSEK